MRGRCVSTGVVVKTLALLLLLGALGSRGQGGGVNPPPDTGDIYRCNVTYASAGDVIISTNSYQRDAVSRTLNVTYEDVLFISSIPVLGPRGLALVPPQSIVTVSVQVPFKGLTDDEGWTADIMTRLLKMDADGKIAAINGQPDSAFCGLADHSSTPSPQITPAPQLVVSVTFPQLHVTTQITLGLSVEEATGLKETLRAGIASALSTPSDNVTITSILAGSASIVEFTVDTINYQNTTVLASTLETSFASSGALSSYQATSIVVVKAEVVADMTPNTPSPPIVVYKENTTAIIFVVIITLVLLIITGAVTAVMVLLIQREGTMDGNHYDNDAEDLDNSSGSELQDFKSKKVDTSRHSSNNTSGGGESNNSVGYDVQQQEVQHQQQLQQIQHRQQLEQMKLQHEVMMMQQQLLFQEGQRQQAQQHPAVVQLQVPPS